VVESQAATVVLVHGAGAGAWMWGPVTEELDTRKISHLEVDLPSVGEDVDPKMDVHADAAHVRALLDRMDGPVLLCGNSYGGLVITEASVEHRAVTRLVYLAAFMPDADDELIAFVTNSATPEFVTGTVFGDDGLARFDPEVVKKLAYQQSSPEVARWATEHLRPMAMGFGGSPTVTGVGWRTIPSTFVVCGEDQSLLPEAQRRWAADRATDSLEFPFDHCPHLSHPVEIASLLATLATTPVP
jgi:pimeloyl-ACP methyl ester carboxylesterase